MKASDCRVCELPSSILVRGVNWVGDTVMTLPAMKSLRGMFPGAHLIFWAPESVEKLLKVSRIPDEIVTFPHALNKISRPFLMRSVLARLRVDLVVLFQNAFESAFTAWMAGIPLRAGYPTDARGPFINLKVPLTNEIRSQHQVYYYLNIVNHVGDFFGLRNQDMNSKPDCSIQLNRSLRENAEFLLSSIPDGRRSRSTFCLCPGSVNSLAKRWPAANFAALADLLIEQTDALVVFMGSPDEREMIDSIMETMKHRNCLNMAGASNLEQSLGIMNLSDLVISNDTGSAHLAVAAGAKVLTIFGPTIPGATAPFGNGARIIKGQASCSPCRHFACPLPEHPCMTSVSPHSVLQTALEMTESGGQNNASD